MWVLISCEPHDQASPKLLFLRVEWWLSWWWSVVWLVSLFIIWKINHRDKDHSSSSIVRAESITAWCIFVICSIEFISTFSIVRMAQSLCSFPCVTSFFFCFCCPCPSAIIGSWWSWSSSYAETTVASLGGMFMAPLLWACCFKRHGNKSESFAFASISGSTSSPIRRKRFKPDSELMTKSSFAAHFFSACNSFFSFCMDDIRCVLSSFYIDLLANLSHIPFHLKATETEISFNSKSENQWQNELRLVSNNMIVNTTFIIDIVIDTDEGFNVKNDAWGREQDEELR